MIFCLKSFILFANSPRKESARARASTVESLKKQLSNKANDFLSTPVISATRKHRALTDTRYKRSEFRIRGDINVMRLINRTEPGVNLDAYVWERPQGYSHLGCAVPLTGRFKMSLQTTNTTISYVLGWTGNTQLIIRKQTSYTYVLVSENRITTNLLQAATLKHRHVIVQARRMLI